MSEPTDILELFGKRATVIKPGLERTQRAWEILGFPGKDTPTILVAGTNGKGSTSGLLWHLLAAHGVNAGLFSSPHLTAFRERIAVSSQSVTDEMLVRLIRDMKARLPQAMWEELTFFEINTLLALIVFAELRTAINVLEVGLGGRFDSTNIVSPCLSVITSIGLDHQQFLGHTTAAVAFEKAGIMRPGIPCIWGGLKSSDADADEIIRKRAAELGAPLKIFATDFGPDDLPFIPPRVKAWPQFLRQNFAVACASFQTLREFQVIEKKDRTLEFVLKRFGANDLPWPVTLTGRFQHLEVSRGGETRRILVDVCHNPHGARALSRGLEETGLITSSAKKPALLSVLADKDAAGIWHELEGKISEAYLFRIASDRSWSQENQKIPGPMFGSFAEAFTDALALPEWAKPSAQPWLICGSVAAVGEVLNYWRSTGWTLADVV